MKKFNVSIAPGYSDSPFSLSDGQHSCMVRAENIDKAEKLVLARAKLEKWQDGHFILQELDPRGVVIKPTLGNSKTDKVVEFKN